MSGDWTFQTLSQEVNYTNYKYYKTDLTIMADEKKFPQLKKRPALGKGLTTLLADAETSHHTETTNNNESVVVAGAIVEIPIEAIEVNPYQPRNHFDRQALEELAESIKIHGIIQPITVRQLEEGTFQLISGERRLQASKIIGLDTITAYIRTANDQQMLEMALIENIQREELNAIEIAHSYQRLMAECNLKQEELGERVGKNRTTVNNYLRLLRLPPDIQAGLRDGKLQMGHARAIINIDDIALQLTIYKKILEEDLSVRKVEELVRQLSNHQEQPANSPKETKTPNYALQQLQAKLSGRFGTKVQVKQNADNKGEIRIPFLSADDLNRILELLGE